MSSPQTLVIDEPFFKEGVNQVASKLGFKSYVTNTDEGVGVGVNYLGEIHRLNIEESVNGETRKLYLIAKVLGRDEIKRNVLKLNSIAATECHIYNYMFPAFDCMQDMFGVIEKLSHPTAHLAIAKDHEELILMEDLSKADPPFSLPRDGKTLDYDHAKLIVETLGHLHALSFAFRYYKPNEFGDLAKCAARDQASSKVNETLPQMVGDSYDAGIERFPEAKNILGGLMEDIYNKNDKLLEEPDEHAVICHGDVWSYNLLFTYKDNKPNQVMLIDWQTIKHISPVMDLLFCLFVCVDEKTRENHLDSFLTIYYDSLKRHLVELRCDPNEIYSEDVFHSHIKKYMASVLVHCLMMLPIFMVDKFNIDFVMGTDNEPIFPTFEYTDMFHSRFRQMANDIERLLSM